jgi:uncharacterized protein (DUF1778 family)
VLKEERTTMAGSTAFKQRLDIRVAEDEKDEIMQAAVLSGSTTSDFMRRTLLEAARRTIQEHTVVQLTEEGTRKFVMALMNPPEPGDNLRALAREFGHEVGH